MPQSLVQYDLDALTLPVQTWLTEGQHSQSDGAQCRCHCATLILERHIVFLRDRPELSAAASRSDTMRLSSAHCESGLYSAPSKPRATYISPWCVPAGPAACSLAITPLQHDAAVGTPPISTRLCNYCWMQVPNISRARDHVIWLPGVS